MHVGRHPPTLLTVFGSLVVVGTFAAAVVLCVI